MYKCTVALYPVSTLCHQSRDFWLIHLASCFIYLTHFGVLLRVPLPPVSKLLITVVYNMYLGVMGTGKVWAVKDMMQAVEWEERECSKCIKNTTITHTQ